MRCPNCDNITKVIDSRRKPGYIYRRRECECGTRFSTKETAFNIVTSETVSEAARLEELSALIESQLRDADASLKGRVVTGGRGTSIRANRTLKVMRGRTV